MVGNAATSLCTMLAVESRAPYILYKRPPFAPYSPHSLFHLHHHYRFPRNHHHFTTNIIIMPSNTFSNFSLLPLELRNQIWSESMPTTTTIHIREGADLEVTAISPPPGQHLTGKEARAVYSLKASRLTPYLPLKMMPISMSTKTQPSSSASRLQKTQRPTSTSRG
jgi:hypothetical protein